MGCINTKCIRDAITDMETKPITLNSPTKYKDIEDGVWYDKVSAGITVVEQPPPIIDIFGASIQQYTDKLFKPDSTSLSEDIKQWANIKWYTPHQIYPNGFTIYSEHPNTNIIRNIEIDDYLLLCLKYIAQRGILSTILPSPHSNVHYIVKLFLNGIQSNVNIDNQIPCSLQKMPIFSYNLNSNEIWASIIEKAFAKIYGNYANLKKGNANDAMKMLTGSPTEVVSTSSKAFYQF